MPGCCSTRTGFLGEAMTENILHHLGVSDNKVVKCAQYEAFEFELTAPGIVTVRNGSYADPENHEYRVNVKGGIPVCCECPADVHHDEPCKHRVAIAIRQPVLTAATERPVTDGGPLRPDDCSCWSVDQELPCFPCFNADFDTPNPEVPE